MDRKKLPAARLANQQIAPSRFKTVKEIVSWMGAMQAQDYGMAKWAIGIRLPGSTERAIESAINKAEIIRTHLLRPTWHFVPAEDLHWMLELNAPRIKASMRSRLNQLGLTEIMIAHSNRTVENALRGGRQLTREELLEELAQEGIALDGNRASHLLVRAELDGIACSGALKAGKQTYALLDEWVPKPQSLTRPVALAKLARTYFTSRAPALLQDFTWWSGLSVIEAKQALEMVQADLVPEIIASQTYWSPVHSSIPEEDNEEVHLLPAFDEYILSYKDRSVALPVANFARAVSSNGIFWPVVVVHGQVKGTWKRRIKKDRVMVETQLFQPPDQSLRALIEKAAVGYTGFLEKDLEIDIN